MTKVNRSRAARSIKQENEAYIRNNYYADIQKPREWWVNINVLMNTKLKIAELCHNHYIRRHYIIVIDIRVAKR